ncbi:MAG TPA: GC-type dockerin domain-anchored protein [Phycisphaerales bacterium]|nr:GC-type dockerin domain-anchored protein [Phycisphaerales bacterium]
MQPVASTSVVIALATCASAQPAPAWRALPALNGEASALLATSGTEAGGNGSPMLWVAGDFTHAGATSVGRAARYNGAAWEGVGAFDWEVMALAEHGGRVYAGGFFSVPGAAPNTIDSVASFNGSGWQALGAPGYLLSWCSTLASYQLPGEPAKLLVSGSPAGSDNYARALGPAGWEDVGGTFITIVDSALVHDDGSGPEVFTTNGTFNGANKFNGTRRATLGGNCFNSPRCLTVWGEGASRRLYVGGNLSNTAGVQVAGAASWNGTAWSGLGGTGWGVRRANGGPGWVHALVPWDDGTGEKLWAVGFFESVGGPAAAQRVPAQSVAAWDGASWSVPAAGGVTGIPADGSFLNGIKAAVAFDFDGPGGRPPSLVIAGKFTGAGGVGVSNFAVLDAAWCGVADVGRQGGAAKHDGRLDNNDFVAFVDLFFGGDPRADVGEQGGVAGRDGAHDNNDFVVFIDAFFDGCTA